MNPDKTAPWLHIVCNIGKMDITQIREQTTVAMNGGINSKK